MANPQTTVTSKGLYQSISLSQAKSYLREDSPLLDEDVARRLNEAVDYVERRINRPLRTFTVEQLYAGGWPASRVLVADWKPLTATSMVEHRLDGGAWSEVDAANYYQAGNRLHFIDDYKFPEATEVRWSYDAGGDYESATKAVYVRLLWLFGDEDPSQTASTSRSARTLEMQEGAGGYA